MIDIVTHVTHTKVQYVSTQVEEHLSIQLKSLYLRKLTVITSYHLIFIPYSKFLILFLICLFQMVYQY